MVRAVATSWWLVGVPLVAALSASTTRAGLKSPMATQLGPAVLLMSTKENKWPQAATFHAAWQEGQPWPFPRRHRQGPSWWPRFNQIGKKRGGVLTSGPTDMSFLLLGDGQPRRTMRSVCARRQTVWLVGVWRSISFTHRDA